MNTPIQIRQYDTARRLNYQLTIGSQAVDLTSATASFVLRDGINCYSNLVTVSGSAESGSVYYDLQARDTANIGIKYCEFSIAYNDGTVLKIPTTGSIMLNINPSISFNNTEGC
jgi:hypothetical protein